MQAKKIIKTLLDDLFFWFNKNPKKIIIDSGEFNLDVDLKIKLEKLRKFLDDQDWSNYFFNLQKLMHEQIIKFLNWNKLSLNFNEYSKILYNKMILILEPIKVEKYLKFVQKVNLYRNTISKIKPGNFAKQEILNEWNQLNNFAKQELGKEVYYDLLKFMDIWIL